MKTYLSLTLAIAMSGYGLAYADGFGFGGQQSGGAAIMEPPAPFNSASSDPVENLATSLRYSSRDGRIKEVQRLLDQGADPNRSAEFGETALIYAARFNHADIANLLLAHGAEVNARDSRDETALEKAAKNCSVRVASILLGKGADVEWVNFEGRTPLMTAAQSGCPAIVQSILKAGGASVNRRDNAGMTALDYALSEAQVEVGGVYTETVKILKAAGAKSFQWQETPQNPRVPGSTPSESKKVLP